MRRSLLLVSALLMTGCGGLSTERDPYHQDDRGQERRAREGASPTLLLHHEFQEFPSFTAREVIDRFRPTWLRPRPSIISGEPAYIFPRIWLDNNYYEDLIVLETIRADNIEFIRFLDSSRATLRYGTGYHAGAIVIESRSH